MEIGLYEWRVIMDRFVTNRQPQIKYFSQLTGAEIDQIIEAIEAVKQSKAAPPPSITVDNVNNDLPEPEPVITQVSFW